MTGQPSAVPVAWRADRVVVIADDDSEVWLFGGPGPVRLSGHAAGPLARAIDGQRTLADAIAVAVGAGMPSDAAERTAERWWQAGHLVATPTPGPDLRPRVLVESHVSAAHLSDRVISALTAAGLDVVDQGAVDQDAVLSVLLVDDLASAEHLIRVQADAPPAVAVQVSGSRPLVSPLLHARASCAHCLAQRIRTRRVADFVAAQRVGMGIPPASPVEHPAAVAFACAVVTAAAYACGSDDWPSAGVARSVSVIDPVAGQIEQHALVPVPGCHTCDPQGATVQAAHLHGPLPDVRETASGDSGGGLRDRDPEQTWARHEHLISDVVGIVPYVRPTGRPELRAFSAGQNAAADTDLVLLRSRLRAGAGGKGLTLSAARAGALAEALERTSLRSRGSEPSRRARFADLDNAILPNDVQLFSDRQLLRAAQLRALELDDPATAGHHRVPSAFDIEAEHDWSPIAALRTGEVHWLPSSMVWLGWPGVPADYPTGSSNGAAAGNTLHEALLQGLLERVERDSVALWWHPRCRRPAFDLDAWDDPRIRAALAPQRALGTDVWVLDITTDLGIPAAVAVAVGLPALPAVPLMGYGAHVDPVLAVVRALTELAQMQAPLTESVDEAARDLLGPHERAWFDEVTVESEPWLAPHGTVPPPAAVEHRDIGEALDDVVDRVEAQGLTVYWADCTRPDIGLPVVRTWAPGLRHFWNRYAPGRLYDVPPALGWCAPGFGEDDLNPRAMIL